MARGTEFDIKALKENLTELKERVEYLEQEEEPSLGIKNRIKQKTSEAEDWLENKIRENPLKKTGMAFGVGIAAGVLLSLLIHRNR